MTVESYYRFHAHIYDATRWAFLFGRSRLVDEAIATEPPPARILEVGCGTGYNLRRLSRALPEARIVGFDLSSDMLEVARSNLAEAVGAGKVELRRGRFPDDMLGSDDGAGETFDLVLFSYALTMFNPGWAEAIDGAARCLEPGGRIAVVDFHDSGFPGFATWMALNHVRVDGHLLPRLRSRFEGSSAAVRSVGPLWRYFTFVGTKGRGKT